MSNVKTITRLRAEVWRLRKVNADLLVRCGLKPERWAPVAPLTEEQREAMRAARKERRAKEYEAKGRVLIRSAFDDLARDEEEATVVDA